MRLLAAGMIALFASLLPAAASAQEPPPSPPSSGCPEAEPARAMYLALHPDEAGITGADPSLAVVEALGPRDLQQGTPVRVVDVIEGDLAAGETIADKQPTFNCLSEGVWVEGQEVFGAFLPVDEGIWTLTAWPLLDGQVQLDGENMTIDELLALGRSYIPPTPEPVISVDTGEPVPTPAGLVPPGTAAGLVAPDAGFGAPSDDVPLGGIGIAGGAMLVGLAALLLGQNRARGRR